MERPQLEQIIYREACIRMQDKGLLFDRLSLKEQYQLMYEIALDLLMLKDEK